MNENHRVIVETLTSLGITANYTGFHYIAYSVILLMENPERLQCVTKHVYPEVAEMFRMSPMCVEKNLRTVAAIAWNKNPELLNEMAGHTLTKTPTNAEFLAILTTYIFLF